MDGKEPDTSEGEKRYRVLLVEDNAIISELMAELLEGLNCTVSIASDGQEAVEVVSTGEWDIVLMDVFMRGLNGIEATRLIKRNKSLQHLPIVGRAGETGGWLGGLKAVLF